ncbi:MAG: hypothetical protein ACR2P5_04730 [Gammaproteobacteria bacterium]
MGELANRLLTETRARLLTTALAAELGSEKNGLTVTNSGQYMISSAVNPKRTQPFANFVGNAYLLFFVHNLYGRTKTTHSLI